MNVTLRQPMTVEQFLAWEERQPLRYEFDGIGALAMVGVRVAHAAIRSNLIIALGNTLRGKPCREYGSDLKIAAGGSIRYPDAFVVPAIDVEISLGELYDDVPDPPDNKAEQLS